MRLDAARPAIAAQRPWRDRARLAQPRAPANGARRTDPEARRRSPARCPLRNRPHHPLAKINRQRLATSLPASSPTGSLNHIPMLLGIHCQFSQLGNRSSP